DADGVYVLELTATDAVGRSNSDTMNFVWDTTAPTASAGSDLNVKVATQATSSASDDNALTYAWSKISGAGTITFSPDATTLQPTISSNANGASVLRLTVTDVAGNVTTDDMTFIWDTAAPDIDAGANKIVRQATAMTATADDDNDLTYSWTQT